MSQASDNMTIANLAALYAPSTEEHQQATAIGKTIKKHAKRTTVAFSEDNHAYVMTESKKRGIPATKFVNMIVDLYKASPEGHI